MDFDKKNTKKLIGIITFGIALFFIFQNFNIVKQGFEKIMDILFPFILGIGIAFVLNGPLKWFENKLFKPKKLKNGKIRENIAKRPISILLSVVFVILVLTLIIKIVIPQIIKVNVMFFSNIPTIANNIKDYALNLTQQYPDIRDQIMQININWDDTIKNLFELLKKLTGSILTSSLSVLINVIGGFINTIIAIIFSIYILLSKEKIKERMKNVVKAYFPEEKAEKIINIFSLSKRTFQNFLRGQFTEAVILGLLCFTGMIIIRIPYASTVSVLIGVCALIPIVGAVIGAILSALLIASVSPVKAVVFIVFLLILQQIEGNLIYPRVVGSSVGLPGIVVLVAVAIGGGLWGIIGLMIILPVTSVLYVLFNEDIENRLKMKEKLKG